MLCAPRPPPHRRGCTPTLLSQGAKVAGVLETDRCYLLLPNSMGRTSPVNQRPSVRCHEDIVTPAPRRCWDIPPSPRVPGPPGRKAQLLRWGRDTGKYDHSSWPPPDTYPCKKGLVWVPSCPHALGLPELVGPMPPAARNPSPPSSPNPKATSPGTAEAGLRRPGHMPDLRADLLPLTRPAQQSLGVPPHPPPRPLKSVPQASLPCPDSAITQSLSNPETLQRWHAPQEPLSCKDTAPSPLHTSRPTAICHPPCPLGGEPSRAVGQWASRTRVSPHTCASGQAGIFLWCVCGGLQETKHSTSGRPQRPGAGGLAGGLPGSPAP